MPRFRADVRRASGALSIKIVAVIVAVVAVTACLSVILLASNPGGNGTSTESWEGVLVGPSLAGVSSNKAVLVGNPVGSHDSAPSAIEVSTSAQVSGLSGGLFKLQKEGQAYVLLEQTTTADTETSFSAMRGLAEDGNVIVSVDSLSIVYDGYTYGVGSDGTDDYVWVAPGLSIPTLFNPVRLTGTIMTDDDMAAISASLPSSRFAGIDLSKSLDLVSKFGLEFAGDTVKFLMVDGAEYVDTVSVRGDVLDVIVPSDLDRLSDAFDVGGVSWIEEFVGKLGEGVAVLTEDDVSLSEQNIWFALSPMEDVPAMKGVCTMQIAPSDLSVLASKITGLAIDSFSMSATLGSFTLRAGVEVGLTSAAAAECGIDDLWSKAESNGLAMVDSVSSSPYCVVVDAQTMIESVGGALDLDPDTLGRLSTLTTFRNPALLLMVDEHFTEFLSDDGTSAWRYAAIGIVPDYQHADSALRHLHVDGVLYDVGDIFGIDIGLPLVISDSVSEVSTTVSPTTVKGLQQGIELRTENGIELADVGLDALVVGVSLKEVLSDTIGELISFAAPVIEGFPLDLCLYEGLYMEGPLDIYHVPIVYIAAGQGTTLLLPEMRHIQGIYIDTESVFDAVDSYITENIEALLPPGVNAVLSDVLGLISDVQKTLLESLAPQGVIIAFSMNEAVNEPPTVAVIHPSDGEQVSLNRFNVTFNAQDEIDFPLWLEVDLVRNNVAGFDIPLPRIPIPVLGNGIWSTDDISWWDDVIDLGIFNDLIYGDYTMTVRAHDFKGYSEDVVVQFSITDHDPDVTPPSSNVGSLPAFEGTAVFDVPISMHDDYAVAAVELWYSRDSGTWTKGADYTPGLLGWDYDPAFDTSSIGDGAYRFYTRAIDEHGNYEAAPATCDAGTFVDTHVPEGTATGPSQVYDQTFTLTYEIVDPSPSSGILWVEAWYKDLAGIIPSWQSLGVDPTPGDGQMIIDASPMADGNVEIIVQCSDNAGHADEPDPSILYSVKELTIWLNVDPPSPSDLYLPINPTINSITLLWSANDEGDFGSYEIYISQDPIFSPGLASYLTAINDRGTTQRTVLDLDPQTMYYSIVRTVDADGLWSDSWRVSTRTFATSDTLDTYAGARELTPDTAWSERTGITDGVDMFKVYLHAGDNIAIHMIGDTLGVGNIYLHSASVGNPVVASSENIGVTEDISYSAPANAYYYLEVTASLLGTSWYTIWLAET